MNENYNSKKVKRIIMIAASAFIVVIAAVMVVIIATRPCEHKQTIVLEAVPASCTEDGKTEGLQCERCGEILEEQETVSATGHSMDEGVITKQQTCTESGVMTYTCTKCGYTETQDIEPHDFTSTVIKESTCTEKGEELFTCKNCGYEKTQELELAEHEWEDMGGNSYSDVCKECRRFKISTLDIKPNEWWTLNGNPYLQFQNAMLTVISSSDTNFRVSCNPICSVCHITVSPSEYKYYTVGVYSPVGITYTCDLCGCETDVMIKVDLQPYD